MPPRHAYWTILIDDKPTAFRARDQEELLPTLNQLKRTNANAVMRWFARGRLWETQEGEREDFQRRKHAPARPSDRRDTKRSTGAPRSDEERPHEGERRGKEWRPGGAHTDPRDRFKKKSRPDRAWSDKPERESAPRSERPSTDKPSGPPRSERPWTNKPGGPPRGDRPWTNKPPATGKRPWSGKPHSGGQPWRDRPRTDSRPPDRRDADAPPRRQNEPSPPPDAEQIRTKPKPPERG
jgi:hypothetical protein